MDSEIFENDAYNQSILLVSLLSDENLQNL